MDANLLRLRTAVVNAVDLLQHAPHPLDPHVQHAQAVLVAAVWHLSYTLGKADGETTPAPDESLAREAIDDADIVDDQHLTPRRLSEYRQERGMTVLQFGRWLGIAHFEYAAVVHRRRVDRRLRDQIAHKLGVQWRAIAEFVPEIPRPRPQPVPIPAPAGAVPPREPWYLVDHATGQIISGPHAEPLPENAVYICDPLKGGAANLVILFDDSDLTEEDQLPPDGYSTSRYALIDDEGDAKDDTDADADSHGIGPDE